MTEKPCKSRKYSQEQIAKLAFDRLSAQVDGSSLWIDRVTIWENDRCWASYFDEAKRR